MKNIIVLISVISMSWMMHSCSSDHETGTVNDIPDAVTFIVNGETKTFSNVEVVESTYTDTNENETVPTYNVLATYEEDNGEFVAFQIRRSYTGNAGLYQFIYTTPAGSHSIAENFELNITESSDSLLKGTFEGPLFDDSDETTPSVTISEGTFSINF